MAPTAAERATARDYCRGCESQSVQRFVGYASDGRENGCRPRAFYRACVMCGTSRLVLADAHDAEGLCRAILRDWLKGVRTNARVPPTGAPTADRIDAGEALGWMQERIWQLYLLWNPERSPAFTPFATYLLEKGLRQWAADASGEASDRKHGRRIPKAHAASVSTSYDGLMEASGGELDLGGETSAGIGHLEELRGEPVETRQLALLIYCGYTQTEAATRLGITSQRAGSILRRLRGGLRDG